MNTFKMVIPNSSINKLIGKSAKTLLYPLLNDVGYKIRLNIAKAGRRVRSKVQVNPTSIGSIESTSQSNIRISKGYLKSTISPIGPMVYIFEQNKKGYSADKFKTLSEFPDLDWWAAANLPAQIYNDMINYDTPLKIRGKTNNTGGKPPLGSPERDVFKIGLDNFILNKNEFGLR